MGRWKGLIATRKWGLQGGDTMDMRCPKCNSTDLKKVSLAYEEGLYRGEGRTRLSAALAGGSGPDLMIGRATTDTSHQSALSKRLSPPAKWSYLKVGSWSVLAFLCVGWIVFYINTVATNATTLISAPLVLFGLVGALAVLGLVFLAWRHNHSTYQRQYADWNRSFVCQRCGTIL